MKIPFFVKSVLIGIPVGVTFFDCIGYIAKVEGKFDFQNTQSLN